MASNRELPEFFVKAAANEAAPEPEAEAMTATSGIAQETMASSSRMFLDALAKTTPSHGAADPSEEMERLLNAAQAGERMVSGAPLYAGTRLDIWRRSLGEILALNMGRIVRLAKNMVDTSLAYSKAVLPTEEERREYVAKNASWLEVYKAYFNQMAGDGEKAEPDNDESGSFDPG